MPPKKREIDILFVWPNWCGQKGNWCWSEVGESTLQEAFEKTGRWREVGAVQHEALAETSVAQGAKPPKEALQSGIRRIWDLIAKYKPKAVVPIGSAVFNSLVDKDSRLIDWVGRDVSRTVMAKQSLFDQGVLPAIVPMFHPDHVATHPLRRRELDTQAAEIMRALRPSTGTASGKARRRLAVDWVLVEDPAEVKRRLDALTTFTVFDFETTGLQPVEKGARIRCVGFCAASSHAFVTSLEGEHGEANKELVRQWLLGDTPKACHNAKFEIKWARHHLKVHPANLKDDTILLHHVMYEESSHRLELLAQQHTSIGGYDDEVKQLLDQNVGYDRIPMAKLAHYCCGDVDATFRLYMDLYSELQEDEDKVGLEWTYRHMVDGAHTLAVVELNGMYFDPLEAEKVYAELRADLIKLGDELDVQPEVQKAKIKLDIPPLKRMNCNSPDQVAVLIYDVMGLPGDRTTRKEVLERIDEGGLGGETVKLVRKIRTVLSDIKNLDEIVSYVRSDGRVNSNFRQDVVVTGRLSSSGPNLQNQRVAGLVKRVFRSRFPGGYIVQADFSQLEVRLFGGMAQEPEYKAAFENGLDLHKITASKIFHKDMEKVSKVERNSGKRVNFGVIFGIGPKKLSKQINCRPEEAQAMLSQFDNAYPSTSKWKAKSIGIAQNRKRISSAVGRVRRLPDIDSSVNMERWRAERQAVNFQIQSLGADITIWCMNRVAVELKVRGMRSLLIGQVHDQIMLDSPADELHQAAALLREVMEDWTAQAFPFLWIPLKVDISYGPSWLEEQPYVTPKGPRRKSKIRV
jgi:DNA polymerase-1